MSTDINGQQKDYSNAVNESYKPPRKTNQRLLIAMKMAGFREISKFAEHCGYTRTYMSQIIHGHIKPTLDQAQQISNKINLRVQDIFEMSDIRDLNFGFTPANELEEQDG